MTDSEIEKIAQRVLKDQVPLEALFGPVRGDGAREYLPTGAMVNGYHFSLLSRRIREMGGIVDTLDGETRRKNSVRARALRT
ncbi:hypothetical protein BMI91_13185 [Thioclava sediminum]|uniref:Uncharacterized protein n=1 Tax=Thioclava sediminum TaxID=1915319 RepID=A0ABX3MUS3_9RHOB|nr:MULTISPECIES: hypothetical protein [Thioclava]OOY02856.1 hypothetical protein BMI87_20595 [Thioclava sp. F28-4]OOY23441.1 hypothetical protein BMI91_13185 [Thioclava sediminum]